MRRLLLTSIALVLTIGLTAQEEPLGFVERFALAEDRGATLGELIPGTEDWYYWHCIHAQHEERFADVPPLLAAWIERHGRTARVQQIENRQALLTFTRDPAATFAFLEQRLALTFDHRRPSEDAAAGLPSHLDPELLSARRLTERALRLHPGTVDGFTDRGLRALAAGAIGDERLTSLLGRFRHPDVPNLASLVVRHLQRRTGQHFGSLPIHGLMTLEQLEECARLMPRLLEDPTFVATWLPRLAPSDDADWRGDPAVREAWLERLWSFVQRLSPAFNSLKAHVLFHRLAHDLAQGTPNEERLLAYLGLPRQAAWAHPDRRRASPADGALVDPRDRPPTGLPAIGDEEDLLRTYLLHFFATAQDYTRYADHLDPDFARTLFVEAKILAGDPDRERWFGRLDAAQYERLRDRVEITFAPENRTRFPSDAPVSLAVDVKNVEALLVKVFAIHAFNYLRSQGPVDASIDLDGVVPTAERRIVLDQGPWRRLRHRIDLPEIDRDGVFVVDLIGNGTSSRAVIRKGELHLLERPGAAGHVMQVVDGEGRPVPDASVWFGGREYHPDEHGDIVVPYSTDPGSSSVILRHGDFATLAHFRHRAEQYALAAGMHVPRETLLPGRRARLLIRPQLTLGGRPLAIDLLEEPVLSITATDHQGVETRQDVHGIELADDRETIHEFSVPEGVLALRVALSGRIQPTTGGEPVALATEQNFAWNGIETTPLTGSPLLRRTAEGWFLDYLGKDGEPKVGRAVDVELFHEDYTDPIRVTLRTDENGTIALGALPGTRAVATSGFPDGTRRFELRTAARTLPAVVHQVAGRVLRVPWPSDAPLDRRSVALTELRDHVFAHDAFDRLRLEGGFLELHDLRPGDYRLWLKDVDEYVLVRITAGVGSARELEIDAAELLQVTDVTVTDSELAIRLANFGASTRVHVFATRYAAPFTPFERLRVAPSPLLHAAPRLALPSTYHSGRAISDEYRYILERRLAHKFPGNMLERPSLLLNPWELDTWNSTLGTGGGAGGRFGGSTPGPAGPMTPGRAGHERALGDGPVAFANLAFLPEPARLHANLRPDADGTVRVPLAELGGGQTVHVLAIDRESTVYRTALVAETPLEPKRRSLAEALPADRHFAPRRSIELVPSGGTAVLDATGTRDFETLDSLAAVHRMFRALTGNPDLAEFAFVLEWPTLTAERKRELYSRYACHELHFFLHEKDREFFDAVVRPYLANKLHETFLDRWLLGEDLSGYLDPWAFERLNVVERILLAQRLPDHAASIARHVADLAAGSRPTPQQLEHVFRTALHSDRLRDAKQLGEQRNADEPAFDRDAAPGRAGERQAEAAREELAEVEVVDEEAVRDRRQREAVRRLYRGVGPTRAYVEHHYWHTPIEAQVADLVPANRFWADWAAADPTEPFVSVHVAEAAGSFAGMMLALAVLDLPWQAEEHTLEREDTQLTLRAGNPLLLLREAIAPTEPVDPNATPLLVSQGIYRLDAPYRFVGNERRDAFVTDELVVDVAYGCRVVVTNPTSSPRDLELLLQVPEGAVPVQRSLTTRSRSLRLEPYATATVEYAFYLPRPGTAVHWPVHVAENGELVAAAEPRTWPVVATPSRVDTTSFEQIARNATLEELLAFLEAAPVQQLDVTQLAWRMRERPAFDAVLRVLHDRHVYADVLWSYGIHHQDGVTTHEYLRHQEQFIARCGPALVSPLLTIDPVERRTYQHVELAPLVHARAHGFVPELGLRNRDLDRQYGALLAILAHRPMLESTDWLQVTYYLLLQDRIGEALGSFGRIVEPGTLATRLQYDYLSAYLAFYRENHARARALAERYEDHPVTRWRDMFREMLAHLDEAAGELPPDVEGVVSQAELARSAPSLELRIEGDRIAIDHRNLESCRIGFFPMDVEFLFSTHPFAQHEAEAFAWVRPTHSAAVALQTDARTTVVPIPEALRTANVLVEVSGGGVVRRAPRYANSLAVDWIETYGQLRVTDVRSGRPLPKAYVKVYARRPGGGVEFHKDGYTDLRGRFDYASVSAAPRAERFAVLVLDEAHGAVIREVEPPAR